VVSADAAARGHVEGGRLDVFRSYGEQPDEWVLRLAQQVDRVFRGTKPADIPFIHPSRFHFRLNRKTASAMGLALPPDLLMLADRIVG
jgi:putative tryptophan/tyrosine transport system substrate-binding protein